MRAPITVTGTFDKPQVGVDAAKAIPQGGIAAALSLLNPLAALIPFVDPGLAKDANCAAAMSEGKEHGAPITKKVKAAVTKTPSK